MILLGCAGMAALAGKLAEEFSAPVVEGTSAGVGFAATRTRLDSARRG